MRRRERSGVTLALPKCTPNANETIEQTALREVTEETGLEVRIVAPVGAIDGHWGQVLNQLAGVGIAWTISVVGTLVLLFVVDRIVGLRVSPEEEAAGLDLSQHNEEGYDFAT